MFEELAKIMGGGSGGSGGGGGQGHLGGSQSGSGMTGNEMAGGLIGLLIGTALGKTNAERNRMATEQSAQENLYSPFTGKRGKDVPIYADYADPLKGLITGIAQGQKMGGPTSGSSESAGQAEASGALLLAPESQQGVAPRPQNYYDDPYTGRYPGSMIG